MSALRQCIRTVYVIGSTLSCICVYLPVYRYPARGDAAFDKTIFFTSLVIPLALGEGQV